MRTKTTAAGLLAALAFALALTACGLEGAEAPRKEIMRPYISVQPQSASYFNGPNTTFPQFVFTEAPTLKVEVYEWNPADGALSFQWYTFTDVEDYCKNGGTAIEGENTVKTSENSTYSEYTPPITSGAGTAAGKIYYYYVEVTNTNPEALAETSVKLQSEIAIIAFSEPSRPLFPVISRSPADAAYRWGSQINALQVRAASADGGNLTYQWYSSSEFSAFDPNKVYEEDDPALDTWTPLRGDTSRNLMPDASKLKLGRNYFFVVVTNNRLGADKALVTVPAVITIEPGIRAAAPRINRQPVDRMFFSASEIQPLTVEAESLDLGVLSYQWYENTAPATTDTTPDRNRVGTPVGGNLPSFTPTVSASKPVAYYYVVITNTNTNVQLQQTAIATSKPVKVQMGSVAAVTPNAYFNIPDPKGTHPGPSTNPIESNTFQYVRGYGGMDVAWGNFPRTSQEDTHLMYNPERLGYNILRIMIRADNIDVDKTIKDLIAGDRPDYYNNVRIVNAYGGYVAASPWTPPKEWKSNNSINGGGHLIPAYYKLYANYLRSFAQNMFNNGAPIYCISISNEPNYVAGYDGCEWEPEQAKNFFLEVGHFTDGIRGYGGGRELPYVLTMNGESANTPFWNNLALRDEKARAAIDLLGRHVYGSRTESLWNSYKSLITKTDAYGNETFMEVWMTEHNINSANATGYINDSTWPYVWRFMNDIDLVIRINNENAFVWWAGKRFYSMVGDAQANTQDGAPLPRGWGLSHYSRYSIDTHRIHVELKPGQTSRTADGRVIATLDQTNSIVNMSKDDMDNTTPRITAFEAADGSYISLVLMTPTTTDNRGGVDMGTMQFDMPPGFVISGVSAHRSTGGTSDVIFQPYDGVALNQARTSAFITMGPSQIISVKFTK